MGADILGSKKFVPLVAACWFLLSCGGGETVVRVIISNLPAFPSAARIELRVVGGPKYATAPADNTFLLHSIPKTVVGKRVVAVDALNADGCVLGHGEAEADVVTGKTVDVTIALMAATGCVTNNGSDGGIGIDDAGPAQTNVALGAACSGAGQCASGFCVDGVCCNTACEGQCEACSAEGLCAAATGVPKGSRAACVVIDAVCGGACNGIDRTQCAYPGVDTTCAAATCGPTKAISKTVCNGAGACTKPSEVDCGSNPCKNGQCGECEVGKTDCATGLYCNTGKCQPQLNEGAACQAAASCKSGACTAEGVCCDRACSGPCEKCSAGGKCTLLSGNLCATALGPCEISATCDGKQGACPAKQPRPATYVCRAADPGLPCQSDAKCAGNGADCPTSPFIGGGTPCGPLPQSCEVRAVCSGAAYSCPGKLPQGSGVECRESTASEGRDPREYCNGTARMCPADVINANLLINGEFDQGLSNWVTNSQSTTKFTVDNNVAGLSGGNSVRIDVAYNNFFTLSQSIFLSPGTYHFAFMLKASRNDPVNAGDGVNFYFSGATQSWSRFYDLSTTVLAKEETFTVTAAGYVGLNFQSNSEGFQKSGTVWVDRLEVWQ